MAKIINNDVKNITYMEVLQDGDPKIRFALIDGRLFLPMSLHDNKNYKINGRITPTNVEVYRREIEGPFVPCEWLAQQFPHMKKNIEQFKKFVQNMVLYEL